MTALTSPVAYIDQTGIHVPSMADVLTYWQTAYQGIYGADTYLGADTQDGQWIGLIAAGYNDLNMAMAAVYNAFSPGTAQGAGLSSVVKINGIARAVASYSTAPILVVGQALTVINDGILTDDNNHQWALPASVTIPAAGQTIVTATCATLGAVTAPAGTITGLFTPTYGWQSATNTAAATAGAPVQTDAQLRIRQAQSTTIPSQTGTEGLVGAILNLPGVASCVPFENDTNVANSLGVPAKSLALVIDGGDAASIASIMLLKKMAGARTAGTTSIVIPDVNGIQRTMRWYQPADVQISYALTVRAFGAFTVDVEAAIRTALASWVNALAVGSSVSLSRAYTPINSVGESFELISLAAARDGAVPSAADVSIAFYEQAICSVGDIVITVTT